MFGKSMNETQFVLMRYAPQRASNILGDHFCLLGDYVDDLQSIRLAQDVQCQSVLIDPSVVADWLDSFQDQQWLPAGKGEFPEPLRRVGFDADDGNELAVGGHRRRVLTL